MAGRPETITPNARHGQSWRNRLSDWREAAIEQLPPREWPGLVLPELEWGLVVARLLLAFSSIFVALQVDALQPARTAVYAADLTLIGMTPIYVVLLRRNMVTRAMTLSVISDTVIVIGSILAAGWLLQRQGMLAIPLEAQGIASSTPIFLIVMAGVIRLKLVPGLGYAIVVPLIVFTVMRILGTDPLGLDGAIPRTVSMMFLGVATAALAYPIQIARRGLVRAVNEKVELVSTVAHELRGPLTSTRAYIELIRDEAAGEVNDRQKSMLDRAMRSATRMEQLIGLFLNVERAENDQVKPVLESVDLASVARDVVDSIAPLASDREIVINLQNVDALPTVQGERQSADQVLANLLSNAVKFSPDRSEITVAAYMEGRQAGLTVSDHGMGISPEDQRNIFQRFYRSEDPRKRRVRGTGLGLYVSRRLTEKMGGTIWFRSTPGNGSTFGFSLPMDGDGVKFPGTQTSDEVAEKPSPNRPTEASA